MADAQQAQSPAAGEGAAGGGGRSKNIIIILLIAGFLLVGLGGGAAFFLVGGGSGEAAAAKGGQAASSTAGDGAGQYGGAIVALDSFVVNLAEENAQRYLKVTMKVEFFGEAPQSFHARRPQIRDLVLTLLSSKTVGDVRTAEGKQQLRDEVIARINRVLKDDLVKAVYFAEFIVQ